MLTNPPKQGLYDSLEEHDNPDIILPDRKEMINNMSYEATIADQEVPIPSFDYKKKGLCEIQPVGSELGTASDYYREIPPDFQFL